VVAREAASAASHLGKIRPLFRSFRTRSISSRRAERPSSPSRRRSFCVGHCCRRDRCIAKRLCRSSTDKKNGEANYDQWQQRPWSARCVRNI